MFTEDVIEKMIIDSLVKNGWEYIPAEELPRSYSDVMVEPMVRDALIRLNPEIAANPSYADEVIIKLRPLFMQAKAADLVTINEASRGVSRGRTSLDGLFLPAKAPRHKRHQTGHHQR